MRQGYTYANQSIDITILYYINYIIYYKNYYISHIHYISIYIYIFILCYVCHVFFAHIYVIYICIMITPMSRSARFCWGGCAPCWREAGGSCEANEAFAGHGAAGGSVESPWEIQLTLGMGQAPDAGHAPEHMSERMPYGMSECMFRRHLQPHTGVYGHIYFVVWIVVFLSLDSIVFWSCHLSLSFVCICFCHFCHFSLIPFMFWWFYNVFVKFQLLSVIFSNFPLVFFTFHWFP